MRDIGTRIRSLRREKGWTQQTLANLCSFPGPWTVSRLETRGTDSLSTLEIVCGAFGIEVWELLRSAAEQTDEEEQNGHKKSSKKSQ